MVRLGGRAALRAAAKWLDVFYWIGIGGVRVVGGAGEDGGVALPHGEFGAAEGAAAGHDVPVVFLPVEDLLEGEVGCRWARGEVGF